MVLALSYDDICPLNQLGFVKSTFPLNTFTVQAESLPTDCFTSPENNLILFSQVTAQL